VLVQKILENQRGQSLVEIEERRKELAAPKLLVSLAVKTLEVSDYSSFFLLSFLSSFLPFFLSFSFLSPSPFFLLSCWFS